MRRRSAATALLLAMVSTATACSGRASPDDEVSALADHLAAFDPDPQAFTDPDDTQRITDALEEMPAKSVQISTDDIETDGDTAAATLTWSWSLDGQEWTYDTTADLTWADDAWRVDYDPRLLEPSLSDGEHLEVQRVTARRGRIVGAGGIDLVEPRPVLRLGLDKTKVKPGVAGRSARRIASALGIDAARFARSVSAAGDEAFVEGLVVRAAEAGPLPGEVTAVPGGAVVRDTLPLGPSKTFAQPLLGTVGDATAEVIEKSDGALAAGDEVGLSGLESRYDETLRGSPGVTVSAVGGDVVRTLFQVEPVDGSPLEVTLDEGTQNAAESALDTLPSDAGASALVALRPSTGTLLAAANGPGNEGRDAATYAQYPPGSTFKIVSALALLRSGLTSESTVDCATTVDVDGRDFENYDDYPSSRIGRITLTQAIANSCNTAIIGEHERLSGDDLADAAAALGLGVDHDVGFPAYFGQVPAPESETEAAADLIGQGTVLASPLAMATVAASVSAGHAVLPSLVTGHEVEQSEPAVPLTDDEAAALRAMMRAVVTEGSGSVLADLPGEVGAKTGTAEYGEPGADGSLPTHAWMIATRGDLAVAVFVEHGSSGSGTAGPVLEQFLTDVR